ncbi:MAG: GAF domain-containing protein [Chloroflexi bacterium]|nr:GAF domain-containing protein [Chloroflexota bacterium]
MISPANIDTSDPPPRIRADESAVLLEIAQAAGSTLELHEVLERVVEKTARLTGADRCSLWLLDSTRDLLLPAAIYGIDPTFAARWKRKILSIKDERLSQEAITTGQPVVVLDAATDPRTDKKAVDFFGDKSILVVPLASKGRVIGTLFLNHISRHYTYPPHEVAIIQAIASQAAVAIENAQLYEESRRQRLELLASFRRIGDALAAGLDLPDTLRLVVDLATEMLRATVGSLTLCPTDDAPGETKWAPVDALERYGPELEALTDLANEVIQRREPCYVADLRERLGEIVCHGAPEALRTYVGVPLFLRGRIIGTLGVFHALPKRFTRPEIDLLASFGAQAAIAIDNARLFTRLQRQVEELSAAAQRNAELFTRLELEKKRLDVIFQNSTDAIFMADRDGRIIAFNPAAELLTGWSACEVLGRGCQEVFGPGLGETTMRLLAGEPPDDGVAEAVVVNRSGERRHVAASYAYVAASNGEGPFALAVVRDISRQKEVERLKSDFISMVSHELRTPLAVIKGYAATLLNPSLHVDAERQQRFLRGINDASDRLTRLIDNLLSVSRFESGRFRLNLQLVDLSDLVCRVVAALRGSVGSHRLTCIVPPEGLVARLDRDQIEQVLVNLVSNAVKYSPEESEVVIELRAFDDPSLVPVPVRFASGIPRGVLLIVRDQGIGIAPNHQRFIFDKFYRGDAPAVRRVAGTGLGLYICKSIVEAHHGAIWVESQVGRGSTFYVALPRE